MADYTKTTDFTAKDALSTGDPLKLIKGSYFDTEFDNIATKIATKYDSDDLASEADAEGLTLNTKLLTPLRLDNVFKDNAGIVGELQALADPGADRIFFWDDGEAADANVAYLTVSNGLEIATATLGIADAAAGAGLTASSGVLAVGGGDGITANADDVALTDVNASSTRPYKLTTGTWAWDASSLGSFGETTWVPGSDAFYISDGGTNIEKILYQDLHLYVQSAQTTQTIAAGDCNSVMEFDGTATLTLPADATHSWPPGGCAVILVDHATQVVTVSVGASVRLNSVNHPGGATSETDTVDAGGMAALIYLGGDDWYLSGNISD